MRASSSVREGVGTARDAPVSIDATLMEAPLIHMIDDDDALHLALEPCSVR